MSEIKKLTHCSVPGHGTGCEVAHEKAGRHPRTTERRLALEYEETAEPAPRRSRRVPPATDLEFMQRFIDEIHSGWR